MQEHDFIPNLGLSSKKFWDLVKKRAKEQNADEILTYMFLMLERANQNEIQIRSADFKKYGKQLELFNGVQDWFARITAFGKSCDLKIEHFIISSGLKEMVEGTSIAKNFRNIYASAFMYDQHGVAKWPALAVDFTIKTQFLFRINKGQLRVWDNSQINAFIPQNERPVPFKQMIFIGDGLTDIPCMKLVKEQGGYSVAVYPPNKRMDKATRLLDENRVNFVAPADYTEGSKLDRQIRAVISRIAASCVVERGEKSLPSRKSASPKPKAKPKSKNAPAGTDLETQLEGGGT